MNPGTIFLQTAISRLQEQKALGDKTFAQLADADFHVQPNEASNSLAIIIRHLNGNMRSRWTNFLTEDGEKPWRQRDEEFEVSNHSREQLLQLWEEGWKVLFDALASLNEEDLGRTITIRTKPLTVVDAIVRQLTHYSNHVGQIIYLGRWIRNEEWRSLSIPRGGSQAFNEEMSRH